jgi:hypothetical protein
LGKFLFSSTFPVVYTERGGRWLSKERERVKSHGRRVQNNKSERTFVLFEVRPHFVQDYAVGIVDLSKLTLEPIADGSEGSDNDIEEADTGCPSA